MYKRQIVNSSSAATENYLAHRLPDKAGAIATPVGLLFLLLAFDWRLGILSLVPVVLGFLIMMKMTGKDMEERMEQYQNALSDMSNEAVEYVRGCLLYTSCGRTELDDSSLEFRFCSKCNGNYEYCQDHLFTHQHVK